MSLHFFRVFILLLIGYLITGLHLDSSFNEILEKFKTSYCRCQVEPDSVNYKYISKKLPFEEAQKHCDSLKMTLATIRTPYDKYTFNALVKKHSKNSSVWIGLRTTEQGKPFEWNSGHPKLAFDVFNSEKLIMPIDNINHCGAIIKGEWFHNSCSNKHEFVCEKRENHVLHGLSNVDFDVASSLKELNCPKCHKVRENMLYTIRDSYHRIPFNRAKELCTVATISNQEENNSVRQALRKAKVGRAFIGLVRDETTGKFLWNGEKEALEYTNWAPGFPEKDGHNCVVLDAKGEWIQVFCSESHFVSCELNYAKH